MTKPRIPTDEEFEAGLTALLEGQLGEAPVEGAAEVSETTNPCANDPIFHPGEDDNEVNLMIATVSATMHYGPMPVPVLEKMLDMAHNSFHEAEDEFQKGCARRTFIVIASVIKAKTGGHQH